MFQHYFFQLLAFFQFYSVLKYGNTLYVFFCANDFTPSISNFEIKLKDPKTLIVTVKRGQQLNEVFHSLSNEGVQVLSMRNETGRLEELFVNLIESDPDKPSLSNKSSRETE